MSARKLTRKEAFELITPVVDDEVDEDTQIAFFAYIEKDETVRAKYESAKRIKEVVSKRCPCANAPDRLKKRIHSYLNTHKSPGANNEHKNEDQVLPEDLIYDIPSEHTMSTGQVSSPTKDRNRTYWQYAAAAAFFVLALVYGIYQYTQPGGSYNVEEYVYAHFAKHEGKMVQPTIATASIANAELELEHSYNMPMTVPPLENAEFKGVVVNEFVPGFRTPMMEYYMSSEEQYIYIFAFKLNHLKQFELLQRSQEAVKSCVKDQDFHIRDVNGKHVVSWKWGDTWYAAISNHNGETLASLVEPLQYTKK